VPRPVEQTGVHTPGQAKDKEAGAAAFALRDFGGITEIRIPKTVGLLRGENGGGHLPEERFVEGAARMAGRQVLEQQRQTTVDPAIAAAPKHLFSARALLALRPDETAVAIEEAGVLVVKTVVAKAILLIEKGEVLRVTRECKQPGERGRGHVECVAPRPAVGHLHTWGLRFGGEIIELLRDRMGDDVVEAALDGTESFLAGGIKPVEIEPGMADGHVIGMVESIAGHPAALLAEIDDCGDQTGVVRGETGAEQAVIEGRNDPMIDINSTRVGEVITRREADQRTDFVGSRFSRDGCDGQGDKAGERQKEACKHHDN
jgi:hypothetical protein